MVAAISLRHRASRNQEAAAETTAAIMRRTSSAASRDIGNGTASRITKMITNRPMRPIVNFVAGGILTSSPLRDPVRDQPNAVEPDHCVNQTGEQRTKRTLPQRR